MKQMSWRELLLQGQELQGHWTKSRLLCHICPHETYFNEKQKVSLAHFSLSATPRMTVGHDITNMLNCLELSTQASVLCKRDSTEG